MVVWTPFFALFSYGENGSYLLNIRPQNFKLSACGCCGGACGTAIWGLQRASGCPGKPAAPPCGETRGQFDPVR